MADAGTGKRGSVLILALWSLFLLSFFCVVLGNGMRQKLELVRRLGEREALQNVAMAAVREALAAAAIEKDKSFQSLNGGWSNDQFRFRRIEAGDSSAGLVHFAESGGETAALYGLEDEESKININTASPQVLERLFRVCGMESGPAQDLAYSVADWRDQDNLLSVPTGSAESAYYRGLRYPYEAGNSPFEAVDELLLVKGMDENSFKEVRKYVTIYGDGKVNINTAPKPVLIALGLSAETADTVIEYRNGGDGKPGTADDSLFMDHSGVTADLSSSGRLKGAGREEFSACVGDGLIGVGSRYFTAAGKVTGKRGKELGAFAAVIDTKGHVLFWSDP